MYHRVFAQGLVDPPNIISASIVTEHPDPEQHVLTCRRQSLWILL